MSVKQQNNNTIIIGNRTTCCPIWKQLDDKNSEDCQNYFQIGQHVVLLLVNYIMKTIQLYHENYPIYF
jgi:hypothetical protein